MAAITTERDLDALTLTFVADFDAPVEKVFDVWADPRKLERWWGPETWPATFEKFEFTEGGEAHYYMTGPDGEKANGWWRFTTIDAPDRLELDDGFADHNGEPSTTIPATPIVVTFQRTDTGTRMTSTTTFASREHMQKVLDMGVEEGSLSAMSQIDAVLADD